MRFKTLVIIFSLFLMGVTFSTAQAAGAPEFQIILPVKPLDVSQTFQALVRIKTNGESINGFEGTIKVPTDLLTVQNIYTGSSIIKLWISRPEGATNGSIVFSGIVPGGYQDVTGVLFSVIFKPKKVGSGNLTWSVAKATKNDGLGTLLKVSSPSVAIKIASTATPTEAPALPADVDAPVFKSYQLTSDPSIFDGEWFLAFMADDVQSGISHYEVAEGKDSNIGSTSLIWNRSESPYLIKDQSLSSYLFIKAFDNSGNVQNVSIAPRAKVATAEKAGQIIKTNSLGKYLIIGIIAILVIAVILLVRRNKKPKQNDEIR